jgi:NAD(P)-dependent dehydrogenase (short-subunit alcohol dehydrogenase family)
VTGPERPDTEVALVTGANKGIGKETARQLAESGRTVLLGSRDQARGEEAAAELAAAGQRVIPVRIDVTEPASVVALAAWLDRRYGKLDALVNNAGAFEGATPAETTADLLRRIYEVNVFGVVTMTSALLPLLRRARLARIVNVSSTTASLAMTANGADLPGDAALRMAYASSKAALNMLTIHYAQAFAGSPELAHIKVNSATPGYTATDMNAFRGSRSVAQGARAVVRLATLPPDGPTGTFRSDTGVVAW